MKPVAAVAAILLLAALALTGQVLARPATALAGDRADPASTLDVAGPLRLQLSDIAPRIVTVDGPDTFTVTGTVTNTGSAPVDDLVGRVQRGEPLATEGRIRDALDGNAGADAVAPQFIPLATRLAPGEQVPFRLSVALLGPPETTLALTETGVYEVLVNVNGTPRGGERARLAATRLLLPVLDLPNRPRPPEPGQPRSVIPFGLLYPITDTPRRLSTVIGEPGLLTDDVLATSFAPDGRLGGLVAALAEWAPLGSPTRQATCIAIDPDLIDTAVAMRGGYQFLGPDGTPTPGTGSEVAARWLDLLVETARGGCVLALPYADADLVSLTRHGMGTAATAAIRDGREVVTRVLQTPVLSGVTWPVDGVVDEPTLANIGAADGRVLVLSADGVDRGRTRPAAGVVPIAGGGPPQFAVLTDPLLTLAASGGTDQPRNGPAGQRSGAGSAAATSNPAGTDTALSTQDAIGALAFSANAGPASDGAPLVLAPPRRWAAEGIGARALLSAVGQLLEAGRLAPIGLDVINRGPPAGAVPRPLEYPLEAGGREIRSGVVETIRTAWADLVDLRSAVVDDPDADIGSGDVFGPLFRELVRPASAGWRGRPVEADAAGTAGLDRVARIRGTIRVLEPPSAYSLGTSEAPLPVTVASGLPLTVKVRIEISSTSGLRVAPIPEVQIPPLGRRQVSTNAEVTRSGRFTVDAAVRTPDGGLLGPPSRLQVQSTAYGTITVWLTAGGGVLLVALVARRIMRRIREPDPPLSRQPRVASPIP